MTSKSLVVQTIDLKLNPLPYGELHLRKGVWDQLQAQKAYHDGELGPDEYRAPALDRKV